VFVIGCFGLPWLWVLNCAYFYSVIKEDRASPILRKCKLDSIVIVRVTAFAGYYMSLTGGIVGVGALLIWIITFQSSWRNWENAKSYMIYVPEEDRNEW
jgi:hypothetical protein